MVYGSFRGRNLLCRIFVDWSGGIDFAWVEICLFLSELKVAVDTIVQTMIIVKT